MDDALDEAFTRRPSSSRRQRKFPREHLTQLDHDEVRPDTLKLPTSSSPTSKRNKRDSNSDTTTTTTTRHLPPPRQSPNSSRSNPTSRLDSNDDDSVMILRQARRHKHAPHCGLTEDLQSLHIGSHEPGPSSARRHPDDTSSTASEELRPLQRHPNATQRPAQPITVPSRGTVVSSSDETQIMQLPFHPPSPRAARGEAKYRTPKPESQLRKLPRGFVWTDPESQLELDAVSCRTSQEAAVPRFCGVRVPENTVYLVERAGIFHRILEPGFRLLVPGLDRVAYVFSKKMQKLSFATSHVHTADRVALVVNAKLFYMVDDPVAAAYAVECVRDALVDLAAAAIHDEFGRVTVDALFSDLDTMWGKVSQQLNEACSVWGSRCIRLFTSIQMPPAIASTYERLAQARLEREIDHVTDTVSNKRRELLKVAENERAAAAAEGRALVLANETVAEREAITMKGEANAQALQSIAEALEKPSGRDAAKVWIASKYIDALSIGLRSNKGSVSIDAAGPARIVDEALNIMDARISSSHRNSPRSPLPKSNRRNTQPRSTHAAGQRGSNPSHATLPTAPASPPPPTVSPPPFRRWPSLESNVDINPLNATAIPDTQPKRVKSGGSPKSGEGVSSPSSRYFPDNYNKCAPAVTVSPPRRQLSVSRGSPQIKVASARSVESPRPPRPPRRSRREGSARSIDGITAADFFELNDSSAQDDDTKSPEAIRRAQPQAERRSSGAALERARQLAQMERRESGSEDTIDRALGGNIERVGSVDTTAGDQAAAGLSPVGGATFISQVSEGDEEILGPSEALEFTIGEVRAEMASPGALVGWNGMARRKMRRKVSNGASKVKPPTQQPPAANKSPNASNMTDDGDTASPVMAPKQAPPTRPPQAKATLEFRRKKKNSPKAGGATERRNGS